MIHRIKLMETEQIQQIQMAQTQTLREQIQIRLYKGEKYE